jgi:hypothetical protein
MATAQYDHDDPAAANSSRPDDPAAAGRPPPERSSEKQHQPSRQRPLDDDHDDLAGDLLIGAGPIEEHLRTLGMPNPDAYYLRRAKKMPIGKFGAHLIASKRRLARHTQKITAL